MGFLPEGVSLDGVVAGHFSSTEGSDFVLYGRRTDGTGDYLGVLRGGPGDIGSSYSVPAEGGAAGGAAWDRAVAVGDATGDGYADIAVGAPYEDVDGHRNVGDVVFLRGGSTGLTTTGAQSWHQATPGVPGAAEAGDHFGSSLRLRDVNGNGRADLAIGAFGEDVVPGGYDDGSAWVLRGVTSGLTTSYATAFNPTDFGFPVVKGCKFADVFAR
ncbi:FG-GAP repeat protein [Streptomyces bungoensis]|uniref:FG-GAP repeat protein n=1 Tax=Streptomyces bungoensis TaxID=285568 RepID=UPI00341ABF10